MLTWILCISIVTLATIFVIYSLQRKRVLYISDVYQNMYLEQRKANEKLDSIRNAHYASVRKNRRTK